MKNYIKYIQLSINKILFDHYSELKLNEKSLIILLRLIEQEQEEFNGFDRLIKGTTIDKSEAVAIIQELIQLDLLGIETKQIEGKWVEKYNFDPLYEKLEQFVIDEPSEKTTSKKDIQEVFQYIEQLYGRALSPAEFERISEWMSTDQYDTETIKEGVDIAFKNEVTSLSYVERILNSLKNKDQQKNYVKPKNWLDGVE